MEAGKEQAKNNLSFFRLFSPIEGELWGKEENRVTGGIPLTSYDAAGYAGYVKRVIQQTLWAGEKGLAALIKNKSLQEKVVSMFPDAEEYGGRLWGVLEVKTSGPLTSAEMRLLQDEWISQAKDGWGKAFEQQPVPTPGGELYLAFYNDGPDYKMLPEQELKGCRRGMQVHITADGCSGKQGYEGATVELPASRYELEDALQRAQVPDGGGYELRRFLKWPEFLSRYLASSGSKTLEEASLLAAKVSRMDETQLAVYEGALQLRQDENIDTPVSMKELINYAYNLDSFEFHSGVVEDRDLGRIAMMGGMLDTIDDLPDEVADLLDERKVGEAVRYADQGAFTGSGYVFRSSGEWREMYDGVYLSEQLDAHDGILSLRLESADSDPDQDSGVWLELPADEQAVQWALDALGERSLDDCVIAESKGVLPSLKYQLAGDEDIEKLNTLAKLLAAFPDRKTKMKYKAVLELEEFPSLDRMLDITENLDCYDYDPVISTPAGYAEYLLQESGFDTSNPAFARFDFAGYGERQFERNGSVPTPYGSINRNDRPFIQEFTKTRPGMSMQ